MTPDEISSFLLLSKIKKTPVEEVRATLDQCSFDKPDENGNYPIHGICAAKLPLIEFAFDRKASLDVTNSEGFTALDIAVSRDDVENVRSLLELGARVDTSDKYGNNPLLSAVIRMRKGYACVDLLLDAGSDPDLANKNGKTARGIAEDINHPALTKM